MTTLETAATPLVADATLESFRELMRCREHPLDPIVNLYQPGVMFQKESNLEIVKGLLRSIPDAAIDNPELLAERNSASPKVHPERLRDFTKDVIVAAITLNQKPHATPEVREKRLAACAKLVDVCTPENSRAKIHGMIKACAETTRQSTDPRMPLDQKHHVADFLEEFTGYLAKPQPREKATYVFNRVLSSARIEPAEIISGVKRAGVTVAGVAVLSMSNTLPAAAEDGDVIVVIDNQDKEMPVTQPATPSPTPTSFDELIEQAVESAPGPANTTASSDPTSTPIVTPPTAKPVATSTTSPQPSETTEPTPTSSPTLAPPPSPESPATSTTPTSPIDSATPTIEPTPSTPEQLATPSTTPTAPTAEAPTPSTPPETPKPPEAFQTPTENEERGITLGRKIFSIFTSGADKSAAEALILGKAENEATGSALLVPDLTDPAVIAAEQQSLLPPENAGIAANIPLISGAVTTEKTQPTLEEAKESANALAAVMDHMVEIMTPPTPTPSNEKNDNSDEDTTNESKSEKDIINQAFKERVEDLVKQSKTPISADKIYDMLTKADNKYKHKAITRELVLSMAYRESLLGKLRYPSSAGARGFVQFMRGTWKDWGKGKDIMDDEANIDAAFRYAINIYNNIDKKFPHLSVATKTKLTLSGYNAGPRYVYRHGKLPRNSSKTYAKWIFASAQKTYDHIASRVKQSSKTQEERPTDPNKESSELDGISFENGQIVEYLKDDKAIPNKVAINTHDAKAIAEYYGAKYLGVEDEAYRQYYKNGKKKSEKVSIFLVQVPTKYARNDRTRELNIRALPGHIGVVKDMRKKGYNVQIGSSFRTAAEQRAARKQARCANDVTYICRNNSGGEKQVAPNGMSKHQTGLAVDYSKDGVVIEDWSIHAILVKVGKPHGVYFEVTGRGAEAWHGNTKDNDRENNIFYSQN